MSAHSHQIFSKVEATLSSDWTTSKGDKINGILNDIEALSAGNVEISFKNGSHVIGGTFDEISLVHNFLIKQVEDEQRQNLEIETKLSTDLPSKVSDAAFEIVNLDSNNCSEDVRSNDAVELSANELTDAVCDLSDSSNIQDVGHSNLIDQESVIASGTNVNELVTDSQSSDDDEIVRMADPDIWDFIQEKRCSELEEFTNIHGISCFSEWDSEEELYKIHLKIKKNKADDAVSLKAQLKEADELFANFFQEISDMCEIETAKGYFSLDDAVVQFIAAEFPNIHLKINPQDIFFIGLPRDVLKAKKQFRRTAAKMMRTELEKGNLETRDRSRMLLNLGLYGNQTDSLSSDASISYSIN